jgi:hypothetical protein
LFTFIHTRLLILLHTTRKPEPQSTHCHINIINNIKSLSSTSSYTSHQLNFGYYRAKMLRRAPTTITLTSTDVEQYESNRDRKIWEQQQQQQAASSTEGSESGKHDELTQDPQPQKSRKDRIMGHGH